MKGNVRMQVLPFPDYALFYYVVDNFRMKNIPDNNESQLIPQRLGLDVYGSVDSIKSTARSSLAGSDTIERSLKLIYLQVDKKYKKLLACNDCGLLGNRNGLFFCLFELWFFLQGFLFDKLFHS